MHSSSSVPSSGQEWFVLCRNGCRPPAPIPELFQVFRRGSARGGREALVAADVGGFWGRYRNAGDCFHWDMFQFARRVGASWGVFLFRGLSWPREDERWHASFLRLFDDAFQSGSEIREGRVSVEGSCGGMSWIRRRGPLATRADWSELGICLINWLSRCLAKVETRNIIAQPWAVIIAHGMRFLLYSLILTSLGSQFVGDRCSIPEPCGIIDLT